MAGFDPERATRQMFVDAIVGAQAARVPDGYGLGWHLIEIMQGDPGETLMTFESNHPLHGWDGTDTIIGPVLVSVSVKTVTFGHARER